MPESKNLPKILREYLINGSFNDAWGQIVLKVALQRGCLNPEELFKIASRINEWGLLLKHLEESTQESSKTSLDYAYRAYGDHDLVFGFRMNFTRSPCLREALLNIQQRRYVNTLKALSTFSREN